MSENVCKSFLRLYHNASQYMYEAVAVLENAAKASARRRRAASARWLAERCRGQPITPANGLYRY